MLFRVQLGYTFRTCVLPGTAIDHEAPPIAIGMMVSFRGIFNSSNNLNIIGPTANMHTKKADAAVAEKEAEQ